jgi:hypothetical protein
MEITNVARQVAAAAAAELVEALEVAPGEELAVRVHAAPADGGRGVLSLAGRLIAAQLPAGLQEGQRLTVRVLESRPDEVVLRVLAHEQADAPAAGQLARAAGALAATGDPQLVRIAADLQPPGLALPLPNGDALELALPRPGDEDEEDEHGGRTGGAAEASFVLHSALLGPIAVRLRLAGGLVGADVSVAPGAEPLAAAAADELRTALERATGAHATVAVAARPEADQAVAAPRVEGSLDAYA